MLFSEGMANQHLASAESNDLIHWKPLGTVEIADQPWFAFRHGAPFVWEEYGLFYMILMGEENADHRSSFGFLSSRDGIHWECALSQE
jgi:sucrose-6-phosphate hydrolase SacC (GH32 family)